MTANIFGSSAKSSKTLNFDKNYVDSKFITLIKNLFLKVNKTGDIMQGNLNMDGNKISNVGEPLDNSDVVTKKYADDKISNLYILSTTGFVPHLTSPRDKTGFYVETSSSMENHAGYKVFNPASKTQWKVDDRDRINSSDFWIKLECPFAVRVYKFCIKPTKLQTLTKWKIQGALDRYHLWEDLEFDLEPIDHTTTSVFTLKNPKLAKPYWWYRIFIEEAEGMNPGLSYLQLYTIDPVII